MPANTWQHIATLAKLHGFEGEALIYADTDFPAKFKKTEWVFLIIDGLPVPFSVLKLQLRSESSAIIKLGQITSSPQMEEFIGCDIVIPQTGKKKSASDESSDNIKGYTVIDAQKGVIGTAETILNYNENYLLQVFNNGKEILIPVNEHFIGEIDDAAKTIAVRLPDGLLDL